MKWIVLTACLALCLTGCASMRTVEQIQFASEPWYEELKPFSKTEANEWALLDMGYPNLPDLKEIGDNPFYDLKMIFR